MRAPDPLIGARVVAAPEVLDALPPVPGRPVLRFAPDEIFVLGNYRAFFTGPGIMEEERGFVGWWLSGDELDAVAIHADWSMPTTRPALAQGLVAGVPAKIWLTEDRALLLCAGAYAHELVERLP